MMTEEGGKSSTLLNEINGEMVLEQLRAVNQLATDISSKCFDACIFKINPRMEESEQNCISNCTTNYLYMKLLFTRRLIDSVKVHQYQENHNHNENHQSPMQE